MPLLSSVGLSGFLSDFFKYVYTVDFLYFMFSSLENALLFLSWIFIIIPVMLYVTHNNKPRDFLGYISVALFWCTSVFLVILSPVSLLLYFLYRWLCKKLCALWPVWKSKIQSSLKKARDTLLNMLLAPFELLAIIVITTGASIYAIICMPVISLFKWLTKKIHSLTRKPSPSPPASEPEYICSTVSLEHSRKQHRKFTLFLWHKSVAFLKTSGIPHTNANCAKAFGVFFYVAIKIVKSQDFANEIYNAFPEAVSSLLPEAPESAKVVSAILASYRKIAPELNESGIDPTDNEGLDLLLSFLLARLSSAESANGHTKSMFTLAVSEVIRNAISFKKEAKPYYSPRLPQSNPE